MRHPVESWRWFGHAGHFICASRCLFHLLTVVGDKMISTIGDFYPDSTPRYLNERNRLNGSEGAPMYFESLVEFVEGEHDGYGNPCGCPDMRQRSDSPIHERYYATAQEATAGHMALCLEAAK